MRKRSGTGEAIAGSVVDTENHDPRNNPYKNMQLLEISGLMN